LVSHEVETSKHVSRTVALREGKLENPVG